MRREREGEDHPTVVRNLLLSSVHDLFQSLPTCYCNYQVRVQVYFQQYIVLSHITSVKHIILNFLYKRAVDLGSSTGGTYWQLYHGKGAQQIGVRCNSQARLLEQVPVASRECAMAYFSNSCHPQGPQLAEDNSFTSGREQLFSTNLSKSIILFSIFVEI